MNNRQTRVLPGLKNNVFDAQHIFRQLLESMSQPGVISRYENITCHPESLHPATYALALTLFDQDVSVMLSPQLQHEDTIDSLKFHNSIHMVDEYLQADFVICNEQDRPHLELLNAGNEIYPDQSCTLIIQAQSLASGTVYRARGPGIKDFSEIRSSALNAIFIREREKLVQKFPLGIDIIVTCGLEFLCIPRTTKLIVETN